MRFSIMCIPFNVSHRINCEIVNISCEGSIPIGGYISNHVYRQNNCSIAFNFENQKEGIGWNCHLGSFTNYVMSLQIYSKSPMMQYELPAHAHTAIGNIISIINCMTLLRTYPSRPDLIMKSKHPPIMLCYKYCYICQNALP